MAFMAVVISLEAWRSGRRELVDTERLERAVRRLDLLARPQVDRDRLAPDVERDLLTIVGELAMGWLDQAAERAERLCDRLVAERG